MRSTDESILISIDGGRCITVAFCFGRVDLSRIDPSPTHGSNYSNYIATCE